MLWIKSAACSNPLNVRCNSNLSLKHASLSCALSGNSNDECVQNVFLSYFTVAAAEKLASDESISTEVKAQAFSSVKELIKHKVDMLVDALIEKLENINPLSGNPLVRALNAATDLAGAYSALQAITAMQIANDPPNFDYTTIDQYSLDVELPDTGFPEFDRLLLNLIHSLNKLNDNMNMQLNAAERYQGAFLSGDSEWAKEQWNEYQKLVDELTTLESSLYSAMSEFYNSNAVNNTEYPTFTDDMFLDLMSSMEDVVLSNADFAELLSNEVIFDPNDPFLSLSDDLKDRVSFNSTQFSTYFSGSYDFLAHPEPDNGTPVSEPKIIYILLLGMILAMRSRKRNI